MDKKTAVRPGPNRRHYALCEKEGSSARRAPLLLPVRSRLPLRRLRAFASLCASCPPPPGPRRPTVRGALRSSTAGHPFPSHTAGYGYGQLRAREEHTADRKAVLFYPATLRMARNSYTPPPLQAAGLTGDTPSGYRPVLSRVCHPTSLRPSFFSHSQCKDICTRLTPVKDTLVIPSCGVLGGCVCTLQWTDFPQGPPPAGSHPSGPP